MKQCQNTHSAKNVTLKAECFKGADARRGFAPYGKLKKKTVSFALISSHGAGNLVKVVMNIIKLHQIFEIFEAVTLQGVIVYRERQRVIFAIFLNFFPGLLNFSRLFRPSPFCRLVAKRQLFSFPRCFTEKGHPEGCNNVVTTLKDYGLTRMESRSGVGRQISDNPLDTKFDFVNVDKVINTPAAIGKFYLAASTGFTMIPVGRADLFLPKWVHYGIIYGGIKWR